MPAGPPSERAGDVTLRYTVFGLSVVSDLPLPDLREDHSGAVHDVTIRVGAIDDPDTRPGYHVGDRTALLVIPDVARFWIVGGNEMTVEPAPGAAERDVRLFVLGSAMAAVLHQRGLLPLHANAVGVGDAAIALLGHSGAGKSTLARWFHDQGHQVLSDDVCVVDADGTVAPGIPRLRLWRDALEASGRAAHDYDLSFAGADKFDVPIAEPEPRALPLRAIYLLGRADAVCIAPLTGARAVAALVANTYRGSYVSAAGQGGAHLVACVSLARRVPLFTFDRGWSLDRFDTDAAALVDHATGLGTP